MGIPNNVDLTHVGIGTSHRFVSTNQNSKVLVAIDNAIQSPVVASAVTTTIASKISFAEQKEHPRGLQDTPIQNLQHRWKLPIHVLEPNHQPTNSLGIIEA